MSKTAFLFAGQGSQRPGMGKEFYEYSSVFKAYMDLVQAEDLDIKKTCFEETAEVLNKTSNAQPCLASVEMGLVKVLQEKGIQPDYAAGLSLGEYSALACAGVIDEKDLPAITRKRGVLMETSLENVGGGMTAVLSDRADEIEKICQLVSLEGEICEIANVNAKNQYVLTGSLKGLNRARALLKEKGISKCIPLKVSGPFHSSYLTEASKTLEAVLKNCRFSRPKIPVVFNVGGQIEKPAALQEIKDLLVKQLYSSVLFDQSLQTLLDEGVDTFIEIGPGKVLSKLVRKKAPQAAVFSLETPKDLERILQCLK